MIEFGEGFVRDVDVRHDVQVTVVMAVIVLLLMYRCICNPLNQLDVLKNTASSTVSMATANDYMNVSSVRYSGNRRIWSVQRLRREREGDSLPRPVHPGVRGDVRGVQGARLQVSRRTSCSLRAGLEKCLAHVDRPRLGQWRLRKGCLPARDLLIVRGMGDGEDVVE